MNALQAARMGLGTVTHFYGHLESLLRPGVELFPPGYDYSNEQVRFSQVADGSTRSTPSAAVTGGRTCASSAGSGPCSTRRSTSTPPAAT